MKALLLALLLALLPGTALGTDTLAGAGDITDCDQGPEQSEQTAALIEWLDPTAVFSAGDNIHDPTPHYHEYLDCYEPTWGRFKERTYPVLGNHDSRGAFARYFGVEPYYAYDLGAWRIYALDSTSPNTVLQEQWLRADLADRPHACVAAVWHHPRYSSGNNGGDPRTDRLWAVLADAGAELVISGHDHDYERFAPREGLRQIVVGTGGAGTKPFGTVQPGSQARITGQPGVLDLSLLATGYTGQFVTGTPDDPSVGDAFYGDCHDPAQNPASPWAALLLALVFSVTSLILWRTTR